jgi:endonuclease G
MQRIHSSHLQLTVLSSLLALIAGCFAGYPDTRELAAASTITEGFEAGTKTAYAVADVTLGTGVWNMDEALIGNSTADVKNGTKSARVRNSGRITMQFDRSTGAGTVTISHAMYGTDLSGTWGLYVSQDHGTTWTQIGPTQSTSGSTLVSSIFLVNRSGSVRLQIRKLDGTANRINFDDITVTDYGTGGGGTDAGVDSSTGGGGTGASISIHTTMGIPSPSSTSDWNSYLSVKSGYVISYNSGRKVPNWVSWELNASYLGSTPRQDTFRQDDTLPSNMPQASLADYSGSGYDRGHMCPSGDRTLTVTANSQTFYLTNMVPQAANNNQGPWNDLENYARSLAQNGKELFIIAGGTFSAGSLSVGSGVKVPDKTFKVIVVLDAPGQGVSSVTTSTRVIAILIPNNNSISASTPWRNFRVSVDSIEALTGQDYLSDVDPSIQSVIEARVDNL